MVEELRKSYKLSDIVAVHCNAGVGRTWTFIAAFLLIDDINKQLAAGVSKNKV